jgi:hypothetical protein
MHAITTIHAMHAMNAVDVVSNMHRIHKAIQVFPLMGMLRHGRAHVVRAFSPRRRVMGMRHV